MSLGSFGYFAGGLTQGYMNQSKNQQAQKLADADVSYKGKLGDAVAAETDLKTRMKTALPLIAKAARDAGYGRFADTLDGGVQPAVNPAQPNAIPGVTPGLPAQGVSVPPYAPNAPTFGS